MGRRRRRRPGEPQHESAQKQPKPELEFSPATEVQELANDLISEYHPHLINARIEYVFRSVHSKTNGKVVYGKARKMGGLAAYLAGAREPGEKFFVMEIAADIWKALSTEEQYALVDHELMHMEVDENTGKLSLQPHDVEEFGLILKRHGLYREDIRRFFRAAENPTLPART